MNDYVGTIRLFVGPFAPVNWALCNGQSLSAAKYPQLFAIIAYTYGGSGANFNVPNLTNCIAIGAGAATSGTSYVIGQQGGTSNTVLNGSNLPAHTHLVSGTLSMPVNVDGGDTNNPESAYPAITAQDAYSTTPVGGYYLAGPDIDLSLTSPGYQQNQSFSNLMPSVPMNYIIALDPNPVN